MAAIFYCDKACRRHRRRHRRRQRTAALFYCFCCWIHCSSDAFLFQIRPPTVGHLNRKSEFSSSKKEEEEIFDVRYFGQDTNNQRKRSHHETSLFGYRRDTSQSTRELVQFLVDEECEGIGLVPTDEENLLRDQADGDDDDDGGVEIGFSSETGIRGLFAKGDYEAGDYLSAIPFPTTLLIDDAEVGENTTDAERGLLFLQRYQDPTSMTTTGSDWSAYLGCLPTRDNSFDPTPDFFTSDQLESTEFPDLINAALQRREDVQRVADQYGVDTNDLQFATWIVKSRCFTIVRLKQIDPLNDPGKKIIHFRSVMIPLLDMINHSSNDANAELEVVETNIDDESFYALQATRPIKANEEITISYGSGQDTSIDLFLNYGFVPTSNPVDVDYLRSEQEKSGDSFTGSSRWSTTLEEDVEELQSMQEKLASTSKDDPTRRRILEFRIKMKRALLAIDS